MKRPDGGTNSETSIGSACAWSCAASVDEGGVRYMFDIFETLLRLQYLKEFAFYES